MFAGKKSAQIREILISESTWEEMTCLFAPSLARVNGSDIERFYYNEDFVEKDGNDVVCEIFIPVRPV